MNDIPKTNLYALAVLATLTLFCGIMHFGNLSLLGAASGTLLGVKALADWWYS